VQERSRPDRSRRAAHQPQRWHLPSSVAFSPDGKTLAGADERPVRLWDVANHRQVGPPLTSPGDGASSVAFSPDGKTLASGSGDNALLWSVPQLADPASFLCESVGQSFARDQWQDLVPPVLSTERLARNQPRTDKPSRDHVGYLRQPGSCSGLDALEPAPGTGASKAARATITAYWALQT
jgi:hypothetical protein